MNTPPPITDLAFLSSEAQLREDENDHFLRFIHRQNGIEIDHLVHRIHDEISKQIDCTACGNCCETLMIEATPSELEHLSEVLHTTQEVIADNYIEKSMSGRFFINTIPCPFLDKKKCSIYANRFSECRDFPHLHKPGFKERLLGTLLHYGRCPIIYNVVEEVKKQTGFLLPAQPGANCCTNTSTSKE